jgi:hypothetical protein
MSKLEKVTHLTRKKERIDMFLQNKIIALFFFWFSSFVNYCISLFLKIISYLY